MLHALLLLGSVEGRLPRIPPRPARLIVLPPASEAGRVADLRYVERRPSGGVGAPDRATAPSRRPPRPARPAALAARPPAVPEPDVADTGSAPRPAAPPSPAQTALIGPRLAEGRLWVRPLPLPPQALARRLAKGHAALVDSAVTAVVQAFLDSIAAEPASRDVGLPSWTTEVAGKKFGLDSKNIYVAGLKIPAAVLALLPLSGGNVDQNKAYNHLMDLRADIQYAAQRADNAQEFKQMIREMRRRKEREREFQRNQRSAPPRDEARPAPVARGGGSTDEAR